jgi:hypothetical protein
MADARFFHKLKPIKTRIGMKAPKRDKKDKGIIPITFRMGLDGNNVRSGPEVVKRAYHEIEDGASSETEIPKIVEGVSVHIFDTDSSPKPNFSLESVTLERLAVSQTENSEGDKAVVLTFETEYNYESEIWAKMGRFFKKDVFLAFDSAQASLLDRPAEDEDESEGPDTRQMELVPKGAQKKSKKAVKDGKAAASGEVAESASAE